LEKDPKKLDLANYELNYDVDPLFKIVTSKFGESRGNYLLQNLLPIEVKNFDYILEDRNFINNNNNVNNKYDENKENKDSNSHSNKKNNSNKKILKEKKSDLDIFNIKSK
jgi:hypothetical protein